MEKKRKKLYQKDGKKLLMRLKIKIYYPFILFLDRQAGSCNVISSNCIPLVTINI